MNSELRPMCPNGCPSKPLVPTYFRHHDTATKQRSNRSLGLYYCESCEKLWKVIAIPAKLDYVAVLEDRLNNEAKK